MSDSLELDDELARANDDARGGLRDGERERAERVHDDVRVRQDERLGAPCVTLPLEVIVVVSVATVSWLAAAESRLLTVTVA